jgi:hypothetical protein
MNFADIRNHLYDQAEKYWWASLLLGLAVQVISSGSTIIQNSSFTIVASTILFFVPIVARWLQEKSKNDTSKALKCRLAILYSDAFGEEIPDDISREIKSWVGEVKLSKAPFRRPYYDSKLPFGANRLADIVSESAFWTYKLAEDMRSIMSLYTGIYLISALTLTYSLFQINLGTGILISAARIVIAMISLVFTSEAIILITQYNELYTEAKRIYSLTAKMVSEKKLKITEIMQIVESYNILLISSPPIPGRLYRFRQISLNKAYKKVISNE